MLPNQVSAHKEKEEEGQEFLYTTFRQSVCVLKFFIVAEM